MGLDSSMRKNIKKTCELGMTLGLAVLLNLPSLAIAEKWACTATQKGVRHLLKIDASNDRVDAFSYRSVTRDGYTCDISASRSTPSDSHWVEQANVGVVSVSVLLDSDAVALVSIHATPITYDLLLQSQLNLSICGVRGYISPVVALRKGKSMCVFKSPKL